MRLITLRNASIEFADIIKAKNKVAALNNIVIRYEISPVLKKPRHSEYDYDELEDAIIECYDNPSYYNRLSKNDLQDIDYREYDSKDWKFNTRNSSYLTTFQLTL